MADPTTPAPAAPATPPAPPNMAATPTVAPQQNTLLAALQQKLNAPATGAFSTTGGVGATTDQAANLLQSKLTGQATPVGGAAGGPARIATGEQVAAQQNQASNKQLSAQLAAQRQGQQLESAGQEQNAEIARQQQLQEMDQRTQAFHTQTSNLLQSFEQGQRQLNSAKDIAALEQVGFAARLSNQQYIDQLNINGQKARINNDINFKDKYNQQVFADQMQVFQGNLDFKTMMDANSRDFQKQISTMSIDQAIQMAQIGIQQQQAAGMFQAGSAVLSGGLQAASAYDQNQHNINWINNTYQGNDAVRQQALAAYQNGIWSPNDGPFQPINLTPQIGKTTDTPVPESTLGAGEAQG